MPDPVITFYFDIRSPYSYLAWDPVFALPKEFAVGVEALPYTVALADAFGTPETRDAREVRKIKYTYMDVRRFAKPSLVSRCFSTSSRSYPQNSSPLKTQVGTPNRPRSSASRAIAASSASALLSR